MNTAFRTRPPTAPPGPVGATQADPHNLPYAGMDVKGLAQSLPSPPPGKVTVAAPAKKQPPIARFQATYFGTVCVPNSLSPGAIPETVHRVMRNTSLEDMIDVFLDIRPAELKIITSQTAEEIKVVTPYSLKSTSVSENDERVFVLFTRLDESRVPLLHGHVFASEAVHAAKIRALVDTHITDRITTDGGDAAESTYLFPPVEPVPQNELLTIDAYYLGYVRVGKKEGAKTVKKAAEVNAGGRAAMKQARERQRVRKVGILRGGAVTTKGGITVEDDPVTIVVTPRSFRIVDRLAGETLFKTLIANITFATSTSNNKGKEDDLFGCIVVNERLSIINCHLFHVNPRYTPVLGRGVADALQRCKQEYGEGALSKSVAPWAVDPDAKRQSAPQVLFAKQIHRSDLRPLAVIGAGEYGEVFLALQSVLIASRKGDHKVRVPRAVKMASSESMKDDFVREALVMLKLGDHENIVRLIGVAVQQSPWLAVLEFVQYGDLRAVLKACREDDIVLGTGEQVDLMIQLARGCTHITSMGVLHMDLAARNCLLGINNVAKVGDFGMSRMMCNDGPYLVLDQKIPLALKWMSIEAMDSRFFSEASDCWSFGVLMWEILTYGDYPYPGLQLDRIQVLVREGLRLEQPDRCPDELWDIVARCWHTTVQDRWKFKDLTDALREVLSQHPYEPRDIGMTVAGTAPPAWALVDPLNGSDSPQAGRKASVVGPKTPSIQSRGSPKMRSRVSSEPALSLNTVSSTSRRRSNDTKIGTPSPGIRRRSSLGLNMLSSKGRSPSKASRSTRRSESGANPVRANSSPAIVSSPPRAALGRKARRSSAGKDALPPRTEFPLTSPPNQIEPNFNAGGGRQLAQGTLRGYLPQSTPMRKTVDDNDFC